MAAGATYVSIASNTLSSAASSITFSSISGAYTDLRLIYNIKNSTTSAAGIMTFNGDSSSIYSFTNIWGSGSTANSNVSSSDAYINFGDYNSTTECFLIIDLMNYSNTTSYKTCLIKTNPSQYSRIYSHMGIYKSNSAISSVTITTGSGQWASGSTVSLYGIAAA